jgi:transketolase
LEDVAAMRALPRMVVLQPADDRETKQAVDWAAAHQGPVYLRITRQKMDDVHDDKYKFQIGKNDVIWQAEGAKHFQATIFASGGPVPHAVNAAKDLLTRGFNARVVNACSLAPFDEESVARFAKDSDRIVTVEDHNVVGGLGSAVCEAAAGRGVGIPVVRVGVRSFGESATPEQLYDKYGLSAPHIVEACLRNLN